jgi:hypothetical protein
MTTRRVLVFAPRREPREAVSPFRHLMPARALTAREVLHRRRMLAVLAVQPRDRVDERDRVEEEGGTRHGHAAQQS